MQIDGQSMGTSSVSRGLARHRLSQSKKAKSASDKAGHPEMPGAGGSRSNHDHAGEEGGHEVIQQIHSEHGPAHTVEVKKEGEHHSVKTTHEDGHEHMSKGHPSVSHVGEHVMAASGGGGDEGQSDEMAEDGGANSGIEAMGLGEDA
jgi:hypothetical protein